MGKLLVKIVTKCKNL